MNINKGSSMLVVVVILLLFSPPIIPADDGGPANPSLHINNRGGGGNGDENEIIKVGVILDMGSWRGQTILSCIQIAISDFYVAHSHYKTRIVLHTRDSMGDHMRALSAGVDLLESVRVSAILGPETYSEAKLLALLADKEKEKEKEKTPIFTFSSLFSSYAIHPFLVQIKQDQIFQFKGLANVLTFYEWKMVNIVYEDSDYGRESLPFLIESLEEERVHVAHKIGISGIFTDYEIVSMLDNLATNQATINIVHVSTTTIVERIFLFVKRMGIMKAGHVWILTGYSALDDKALVDSMQAVVIGIKAHIPASSKLKEFTIRQIMGFKEKGQKMEVARQPCSSCILAYDTLWALADCLERVEKAAGGRSLLNEMGKSSFAGLSGEFRILNGKIIHSTESYAIIHVNSKGERIVGYWTGKHGLLKEAQVDEQLEVGVPRRGLQAIAIWPKDRVGIPPRGLTLGGGKKLRICVLINSGFPEFVDFYHDPLSGSMRFKGYCIDVFLAVISSLNYDIAYELMRCDVKEPYTYGEVIDQIYAGVYDGVLGDVTITANRSLYVDFTMPYTDLGVGTIAKRSSRDMWVFTRALNGNLWLMSGILFALVGVVVWIIEHPDNEDFQGTISKQVGTMLSFGFSTLVYAHREKLKSNLSKFVVNVWLCVVLILTSSYTATLSSMMTIKQIQLASVDNIGTQSALLWGAIIASNVNFTYNQLKLYNSPAEYADALTEGSKKGGVTAIIDEIPYINIFLAKYGRDYSMIASASTTSGFGFAFQKGFPRLVSDMSQAILQMREDGKLAKLEEEWYNNRKSSSSFIPEADATNPNALDLHSFRGLFLIISISIAFALILHLIFMLVKRVQANSLIEKVIFGGHFAFLSRFLSPRNQNVVQLATII